MSPGKAAAQTAHAARLSLLRYIRDNPSRADEFIDLNSAGSMVVLGVPNLRHLEKVAALAAAEGVPHALFVDSGHIMLPHFDGSPTPTALAIGPASRTLIKPMVRAYQCL